jgi:hypothetical protein
VWKAGPTAEAEENLERIVSEIKQLDPEFKFQLPKL